MVLIVTQCAVNIRLESWWAMLSCQDLQDSNWIQYLAITLARIVFLICWREWRRTYLSLPWTYECIRLWKMLRDRLEPLMLEAIRQSQFTNNDATRLLVRSREIPDDPLKYTIEYVQAALSLEKMLCVMLYDEDIRHPHVARRENLQGFFHCRFRCRQSS